MSNLNEWNFTAEELAEITKFSVIDPVEVSTENKKGGFELLVQDYIEAGYDELEAKSMAARYFQTQDAL